MVDAPASEFKVEVVRLGKIEKHPNADTLGITRVHGVQAPDGSVTGGYPVTVKLGAFQEGGLAVYVPIDSLVPTASHPFADLFSFLHSQAKCRDGESVPRARIRAAKIRGIFSMGLLVPVPVMTDGVPDVGEELSALLGITKYEPPEAGAKFIHTESEPDPGYLPKFGLVALRRYGPLLQDGEEVIITEKIHGANGRAIYEHSREDADGRSAMRLWMGSHTQWKKPPAGPDSPRGIWWQAAEKYELEKRLMRYPGLGVYFEVFGQVQDLKYGETLAIAVFAMYTRVGGAEREGFLDWDQVVVMAELLGLPLVPMLYRGPWRRPLADMLAEGPTMWPNAHGDGKAPHVREGIVVTPVRERWDEHVGRVSLKLHGEGYLTRKGG